MGRLSGAVVASLSLALVTCSPGMSWGQEDAQFVECSGAVIDGRGAPVAGAEVVCAEQRYDYAAGRIAWGTPALTKTGTDGRFRVQVQAERKEYVWAAAWKQGLSLGWQWSRGAGPGEDMTILLSEPAVLAGVVVDEAGKPVPGATVRPCLKMGWMGGSPGVSFETPREWFTARTDEQGRFRFDRIPASASADFWAEAPGLASCWTYWEKELSDMAGSRFQAGQTDVRIVLKPEAVVRGRVIDEDTGQGVAGVLLLARPNARYANYSCVSPVTSGPAGAFTCRGLAPNDYSLQLVAPQERTADWTAQDVKVTAVPGRTVDVNVPVGKGGLIQAIVLDAATSNPIKNARVNVTQAARFGQHPCWCPVVYTNAEGIALLRVPPGKCQMNSWAQSYEGFVDPGPLNVAKGRTIRRLARLDPYPIVTGMVRDPNGRPAAGMIVNSKPACEAAARTDEQGRFRVSWRPGPSMRDTLVLARDPARNLAGMAPVQHPSRPVEVTLAPALAIRGRVTDPNGKAISAAAISLRASMPGYLTDGAPAVFTDAAGAYEIRAVLTPRENFTYRLQAHARGYGPTELKALPFDAAQNGQVSVATIILPLADQSISGVVVDANDVPGAGLPIFISGPRGSDTAGQPRLQTISDEEGRFAVAGVCVGPLRIQAGFTNGPRRAGFLDARGGDRDVKVVLGREGVHAASKSPQGPSDPAMTRSRN